MGGLFVLGTERHDARRIDNQLRGRSGRQGDPGETQFFVSMEDHIMRVFAADTVKNMMGRLGIPEDEAIQNKLISRSLESAQQKIEGLNFDSRKYVLEYDDVLNFQRKIFYERRRVILIGEQSTLKEYLDKVTDGIDKNLKKIIETKLDNDKGNFWFVFRSLCLQTFDMFWVEHLEQMDYLRSSVHLRAYVQRDPLVEYKKEGLRLFKQMESSIEETILNTMTRVDESVIKAEAQNQYEQIKNITLSDGSNEQSTPRVNASEVGRNDPCPCGSGKKYKKCHGANL